MRTQATKEKILLSAIEAIEKFGIQNLTTRTIAQEAGVNNAALHYYFGTKELLLEAALTATIDHWVADTVEILGSEASTQDRLRAILEYLVDGVIRYPNLIRAHIQGPLMEGDPDSPFMAMLSTWLDQAVLGLEDSLPPKQQQRLRIAIQSMVSSILVAGLMPQGPGLSEGINLQDEANRAAYIEFLTGTITDLPQGFYHYRPDSHALPQHGHADPGPEDLHQGQDRGKGNRHHEVGDPAVDGRRGGDGGGGGLGQEHGQDHLQEGKLQGQGSRLQNLT